MTTIYVDADACPVKDEVVTIAIRHECRAVMVCNGGIRPNPHPLIDLAIVDDGPDAADIWIADQAGAGDIVITSDIPLAARAVAAGSHVLRPDGSPITPDNVGATLATRDLMRTSAQPTRSTRDGGVRFRRLTGGGSRRRSTRSCRVARTSRRYTASPATNPDDQAHWKL